MGPEKKHPQVDRTITLVAENIDERGESSGRRGQQMEGGRLKTGKKVSSTTIESGSIRRKETEVEQGTAVSWRTLCQDPHRKCERLGPTTERAIVKGCARTKQNSTKIFDEGEHIYPFNRPLSI